jgi:hypothetical protein
MADGAMGDGAPRSSRFESLRARYTAAAVLLLNCVLLLAVVVPLFLGGRWLLARLTRPRTDPVTQRHGKVAAPSVPFWDGCWGRRRNGPRRLAGPRDGHHHRSNLAQQSRREFRRDLDADGRGCPERRQDDLVLQCRRLGGISLHRPRRTRRRLHGLRQIRHAQSGVRRSGRAGGHLARHPKSRNRDPHRIRGHRPYPHGHGRLRLRSHSPVQRRDV